MESFASRLKFLRNTKGITQLELAGYLGVSKSTIGMYESGKREPSLEVLSNLADYFSVDLDYLSGKTDVNSRPEYYAPYRDLKCAVFLKKKILQDYGSLDIFSKKAGIPMRTIDDALETNVTNLDAQILVGKALGVPEVQICFWDVPLSGDKNTGDLSSVQNQNETKTPIKTSELTEKDEKDVAKTMRRLKNQLITETDLMFDGEAMDPETIKLLLQEIEQQERIVKAVNKKYTPKKYR